MSTRTNQNAAAIYAAILIITKPIFKHERPFDDSNQNMKYGRNHMIKI